MPASELLDLATLDLSRVVIGPDEIYRRLPRAEIPFALLLFNVGPDTTHFVTQVSPYAQGKRLAINGWWTGPASTGKAVLPAPERIDAGGASIEIY